ncbi:MAG: hypothetical protein GY710_05485 [Desulfobacteraceae bacterium]|nr:hypothetical protein [Desulfobacteraceae bacterium]
MGENIILFSLDGLILSSTLSDFRPGNKISDYIRITDDEFCKLVMMVPRGSQPLRYDFEVLFKGRYQHRTAEIYNTFDGAFVWQVNDRIVETNTINYADLKTKTQNIFLISDSGRILRCKYPERTLINNPIGSNIFDFLLPKYVESIREAMAYSLEKKIELPIKYSVLVDGQVQHKIGTIRPDHGNLILTVKRVGFIRAI